MGYDDQNRIGGRYAADVRGKDLRTETALQEYETNMTYVSLQSVALSTEDKYAMFRQKVAKREPAMVRDSDEFADFEETFLTPGNAMNDGKAYAMAERLHAGQTDQLGVDYMEHPKAVCGLMQLTPEYCALTPEEKRAATVSALLHDTVEDTALVESDLGRAGCSPLEISTIMAVTARKNEPKTEYYARVVAAGPVAVAVKLGDLAHNTSPERREQLPGSPSRPVRDGEEDRFTRLGKKYWVAYAALGAAVPEHLQQFAPR